MAARGHSVDVMLRFYRLGHAFFTERLHREILEVISDPDALLAALEELESSADRQEGRGVAQRSATT